MRALLTEAFPGQAAGLAAAMTAQGHAVFTCHTDSTDLRCAAIRGGGPCPLDTGAIDVVIDVRRDAPPELTTREYAVVCARRAGVALVVVGDDLPASGDAVADWALITRANHDAHNVETFVAASDKDGLTALRAAVREFLGERNYDSRANVYLVDHGFYVDVVVQTSASISRHDEVALGDLARSTLRPYRDDWVHARLALQPWSSGAGGELP